MSARNGRARQLRLPAISKCVRALICIFFSTAGASALAAEYEAPAVKAAFLHRFAAYVQWPAAADRASAPFTIAVLGDPAVFTHLQRLQPGLTIQNRRAEVRSVSSVNEIGEAQILYIGSGQAARAQAVANAIKAKPILVVTGHENGLADGAAINFVQVGRNVRFEVSLPAARRSGLQINSGLLSVAVRVEDEPRANSESSGWPTFTRHQQMIAHGSFWEYRPLLASWTTPTNRGMSLAHLWRSRGRGEPIWEPGHYAHVA